ncbi:hypothetical protein L6R53_27785, partial [Myxococcota bacterium]|nr:hypothetical protein [Myxococcota bacterium]
MRVVIDTSVARAASVDGGAPAPACAQALRAIEGCHSLHVAMSPSLKQEWQRHRSLFATQWLGLMIARKRLQALTPVPRTDVLDAAADLPGKRSTAVSKDLHLVDLAFASDRRILALDDTQRALLCRLVRSVPDLASLHWANPTDDPCVPWLAGGAPDEPALCLRSPPPPGPTPPP